MRTLRLVRAAFPMLVAASACGPVPVADVTLALRMPLSRDLIEESDRVARDITVDGRDFGAELVDPTADSFAFTLDISPDDEDEGAEARVMSVTLLGRVGDDPIAFGGVSGVLLPTIRAQRESGAEAVALRVPMILGPLDAPARLNEDVTERRNPAVCGSDAGRAWILGGTVDASAKTDGFVLDEASLAVQDPPIDVGTGWTAGDCLIDGDDTPILFGGCSTNGTALNFFHEIRDGVALELLPGEVFAGCGAKLRHGPGEELWFVTPESAELRRRADGFTSASAVLDVRNAPQAASTTTGDLVLARGTDGVGALVTTAVGVLAGSGDQQPIPDLNGAVLADFGTTRDPIGLLPDGDLKSVTRSGQQFGVRQIRSVDLSALVGVVPEQLLVFGPDDRIVVLSTADGSGDRTLLIEDPDGTLVVHSTRRDRIVKGPTHSLLLAGGEELGLDVIMLR